MYLRIVNVHHILENVVSMQHSFEAFLDKLGRVKLKFVGNFIAKTVFIESANQFSLEELCKTDIVQLEIFWRHIVYLKNTNSVEGVEILLPIKFH